MSSLSVRGIQKRLGGKRVLKGISFEAEAGDIVSIIGPSGGGKTTLLRCILGELIPDKGRLFFDGEDVTHKRVEKRRVGVVYQEYALFPHMTAAENIGYSLKIRRMDPQRIEERVAQLMELVRLPGKGDKYPVELSGGERQRVALARSLAIEPRLLLLDEAFTALDATTRTGVIQEVRNIIRRLGLTTVLVTHDQEEAFLFARHVIVLNDGRMVAHGPPDEVMKHDDPFIVDFVKMVMLRRVQVQGNSEGDRFVRLEGGAKIPVNLPGIEVGNEVHVMVKKAPDKESVEVWPVERS